MKIPIALLFVVAVSFATGSHARGLGHSYGFGSTHHSSGEHYTNSYFRHDGTHVEGYHSTNPNRTRNDNFSTRGNANPYTGTAGTKPRDEDVGR
jgi:hypothetical protein